jgi:hypothetical protein
MTIVSGIMAVSMIGTAGNAATAEGADYSIAKMVATAKMVQENPDITSLGPIEIDSVTWRYTVKNIDGTVIATIYPWKGLETLSGSLAEAVA